MRRCLEKNPEQRFQSARDLSFALSALSGTETSTIGASCRGGASPDAAPAVALHRAGAGGRRRRDLVVRGAASRAHDSHAVRPGGSRRNEHQPHGALARWLHAGVRVAGRKLGIAHALRAARRLVRTSRLCRARREQVIPSGRPMAPTSRFSPMASCRKWRSQAARRKCSPALWPDAAAVGEARV